MDKIINRLKSDYDYVASLGYDVMGVFLQGSQNYGLSYEKSDIDTKCIIIPSLKDFCYNKKPVSTTLVLPSNEHIDVKDIRFMFDCIKKQNINFVGILFTDYFIANPEYAGEVNMLRENAEAIAHFNNYAAVNCMEGMAMEKYKALEHPYPATLEKIEKYGWDGKQLHHEARILEFLQRYIDGEPYRDCLMSKQREYLMSLKMNEGTLDAARQLASDILNTINEIKQNYMATHELHIDVNAESTLCNIQYSALKKGFLKEALIGDRQ